jgi:hypothetical protein
MDTDSGSSAMAISLGSSWWLVAESARKNVGFWPSFFTTSRVPSGTLRALRFEEALTNEIRHRVRPGSPRNLGVRVVSLQQRLLSNGIRRRRSVIRGIP